MKPSGIGAVYHAICECIHCNAKCVPTLEKETKCKQHFHTN